MSAVGPIHQGIRGASYLLAAIATGRATKTACDSLPPKPPPANSISSTISAVGPTAYHDGTS